jgi:DNA-binding response OmpR family regulator
MNFQKGRSSVMVVDDDLIVGKLLKHTLTQRGFDVQVVEDGRAAISNVSNQNPPSLVLLDILLPFADGFEILDKIRNQSNWQKVPILMLTSKTTESNIVRAFESGANDYVTKPFQVEELMSRIRRLLK